MLGRFDGNKLELEQVHRFGNGPIKVHQNLYWNILKLYDELKTSLRMAAQQYGKDFQGVGIDTWGVDFGLLDANDELLGNPHSYRDPRTSGMLDEAFRRVPRKEIFEHTGIQFLPFNSVFQLLAMTLEKSPILGAAKTLLMVPDLLNFWFTGAKVCEFSNATTTQFFDPRKGNWSTELLDKLGIPHDFLPQIVDPGTVIGKLTQSIAEDTGMAQIPMIAPATHDTGSAVAAVPARGKDHMYISSGTWSLMGCELDKPLINEKVLAMNFTNEGGVGRTYRFLKNIMGLWVVQECRRTWAQAGEELSYTEITQMAAKADAYASVIDVDDMRFLQPGDMPARIR
jgi:rhamnulokinase